MRVSEVSIHLVKPKNGLIAFASLVIEDALFLSGIAVHQKLNGGHRLTFPTRKTENQSFTLFHPINRLASQAIEAAILTKLNDVLKETGASHAGHDCPDAA